MAKIERFFGHWVKKSIKKWWNVRGDEIKGAHVHGWKGTTKTTKIMKIKSGRSLDSNRSGVIAIIGGRGGVLFDALVDYGLWVR